MKQKTTLKKPTLSTEAAIRFAEAAPEGDTGHKTAKVGTGITDTEKHPSDAPVGGKSGLVPDGDVRLSANIDRRVHLKLKIAAAEQRTTIGELIEQLVTKHMGD